MIYKPNTNPSHSQDQTSLQELTPLLEHEEDTNHIKQPENGNHEEHKLNEDFPKPEEQEQEPTLQNEHESIEESMGMSRSVPRAKSHSHPHLSSSGFTPSSPPRDPQPTLIGPNHTRPGPRGLYQSHLKSQPKPWSERTSLALGIWMPLKITWRLHPIVLS